MDKVFLDTNIFVYAYDHNDRIKNSKAAELIESILYGQTGNISSQVIQEFCNVLIGKKLQGSEATFFAIDKVLKPMLTHLPSVEFYKRAVSLIQAYSLSFYDALIVQAAIDLDCKILYSEDLQHGQKFGKLKIINPFL